MTTQTQIPQMLTAAIADITRQTMDSCAAALAEKYGFDPVEAQRFLESHEVKATKTKAGKKASKSKIVDGGTQTSEASGDSTKPKTKRGQTGYLMFASETRPLVKAEMMAKLDDGAKLQPQAVVKELATRWKGLDEDERAEWNSKAKTPPSSSSDNE